MHLARPRVRIPGRSVFLRNAPYIASSRSAVVSSLWRVDDAIRAEVTLGVRAMSAPAVPPGRSGNSAARVPMSEVGVIFDADRHRAFAACHGAAHPAVVVTVLPERSS